MARVPSMSRSTALGSSRSASKMAATAGPGTRVSGPMRRSRLQDGGSIRLQDLPLGETAPKAISTTEPPFSFVYGRQTIERPAQNLAVQLVTPRNSTPSGPNTRLMYTDPATGLQVRCVSSRLRRLPHGGMDPVLQEHRLGRHADRRENPGSRHPGRSQRRPRVSAPPQRGFAGERQRLRPAGDAAGPRGPQASGRFRRPADQHRLVLFQPGMGRRRAHRLRRLAGPVGGRIRSRREPEVCTSKPDRS